MRRRAFLGGVAAAIVGAPLWLRRAFADASVESLGGRMGKLSAAFERAESLGKPLLVLMVPDSDEEMYLQGTRLGELLNHGSDAQLAPIALAEVVCARRGEVPGAPARPNTLAFLVESGQPVLAIATDKPLPGAARGFGEEADEEIDERIAAMAAAFEKAIVPDAAARARHADRARIALGAGSAAVDAELAAATPSGENADRGAAIYFVAAQGAAAPRKKRILHLLAEAVRNRTVKHAPPGSHWANASSCGGPSVEEMPEPEEKPEVEQVDGKTVIRLRHVTITSCGMGFVPAKSSRFLYFYSRTPKQRSEDWAKEHAAKPSG
jgi:hypothetical protein